MTFEFLGSVLGGMERNGPSMSYVVTDFRDDHELLKSWGAIHRREFQWSPSWGDEYVVYSAKHPTAKAADKEARHMALQSGYVPPKWWHFWRAGEAPLPPP